MRRVNLLTCYQKHLRKTRISFYCLSLLSLALIISASIALRAWLEHSIQATQHLKKYRITKKHFSSRLKKSILPSISNQYILLLNFLDTNLPPTLYLTHILIDHAHVIITGTIKQIDSLLQLKKAIQQALPSNKICALFIDQKAFILTLSLSTICQEKHAY